MLDDAQRVFSLRSHACLALLRLLYCSLATAFGQLGDVAGPRCDVLLQCSISGSRAPSAFVVELGAAMIVAPTMLPFLSIRPFARQQRVERLEDVLGQVVLIQQVAEMHGSTHESMIGGLVQIFPGDRVGATVDNLVRLSDPSTLAQVIPAPQRRSASAWPKPVRRATRSPLEASRGNVATLTVLPLGSVKSGGAVKTADQVLVEVAANTSVWNNAYTRRKCTR